MKLFIALFLTLGPVWALERMICYPENEVPPPFLHLKANATDALPHASAVAHYAAFSTAQASPTAALPHASAVAHYAAFSTAQVSATKVIPVVRDGQTCPIDTEPSAEHNGQCMYGIYTGSITSGLSGKCCFHSGQMVFLYSVVGTGRTDTEYVLDGRPCCSPDTYGTALVAHGDRKQCEYGKEILSVPNTEYLTKCCWDPRGGNFKVHLRDFRPYSLPINKGYSKRVFDPWPHSEQEDVGIQVHVIDVYGYYVAVKAKIWVSGIIDWSEEDTFNIYLDHDWKVAKNWYPGSDFPGHVSIDAMTKINEDRSLDLKLHITGTKLFGRLEETVGPFHIDDQYLKQALTLMSLC